MTRVTIQMNVQVLPYIMKALDLNPLGKISSVNISFNCQDGNSLDVTEIRGNILTANSPKQTAGGRSGAGRGVLQVTSCPTRPSCHPESDWQREVHSIRSVNTIPVVFLESGTLVTVLLWGGVYPLPAITPYHQGAVERVVCSGWKEISGILHYSSCSTQSCSGSIVCFYISTSRRSQGYSRLCQSKTVLDSVNSYILYSVVIVQYIYLQYIGLLQQYSIYYTGQLQYIYICIVYRPTTVVYTIQGI